MVLERFKKNKKNDIANNKGSIKGRKSGLGHNRKKSSVLMDAPCKDFIVSVYNNLADNTVNIPLVFYFFKFLLSHATYCMLLGTIKFDNVQLDHKRCQ